MGLVRPTTVTIRTNSFSRFQTPMICCHCLVPKSWPHRQKRGTQSHRVPQGLDTHRGRQSTWLHTGIQQTFIDPWSPPGTGLDGGHRRTQLHLPVEGERGHTLLPEGGSSGSFPTPSAACPEKVLPLLFIKKVCKTKAKTQIAGEGGGAEEFPRAPLRQGRDRQWVEEWGG